jgi:hypothetical protein
MEEGKRGDEEEEKGGFGLYSQRCINVHTHKIYLTKRRRMVPDEDREF